MTTRMKPASTFGSWLDGELQRRDWKGADLARALGVANGDVSRWIRGKTIPSPASIAKIADVLFADQDYLLALAGHRDRDLDRDLEAPAEQIAAMARRVKWKGDRYETARAMLHRWIELDREAAHNGGET